MMSLIEQHRPEVAALRACLGLHSLALFGSLADSGSDAARSGIDLLSATTSRNRYFIATVNQSRQTVYASPRIRAA
jgi:predicted nucleotidyltransferase